MENMFKVEKSDSVVVIKENGGAELIIPNIDDDESASISMIIATAIALLINEGSEEFKAIVEKRIDKLYEETDGTSKDD